MLEIIGKRRLWVSERYQWLCLKWYTNQSGEIPQLKQVQEKAAGEVGPFEIQSEPGKGLKAWLSMLKSCEFFLWMLSPGPFWPSHLWVCLRSLSVMWLGEMTAQRENCLQSRGCSSLRRACQSTHLAHPQKARSQPFHAGKTALPEEMLVSYG